MELNRNIDIIRANNTDYVNVKSNNRLIRKMVESIAEDVYSFNILFGSQVDAETAKEMKGTYWMSSGPSNGYKYGEDVQIVER